MANQRTTSAAVLGHFPLSHFPPTIRACDSTEFPESAGASRKCLRHDVWRADATFILHNDIHGLLRIIREREQIQVAGADKFSAGQGLFHPGNQAFPVSAPEKNQRKL